MKRLAISLVLALLALSLAVYSYFDVCKNTEKMISSLEAGLEIIESGNGDFETPVKEASARWEKCRERFELYLYSEELFETDMNFSKIEKLLGTDNTEELKELLYENINNLRRLADNQSPTLRKVF